MRILKMTMAFAFVSVGFLSLINDNKAPQTGLRIGDKAPEIRASLINGSYFNLDDLKGKMVLVDFWASYDANQRIQNSAKTELLTTYNSKTFLKGQGFEIVSISLDRFNTPLNRAIKADRLEYGTHICDLKGKQSTLVAAYQGHAFKKYLVDGDGRIVAASESLDEIAGALQRLTKN
jgi:peroxiredoxin